RQVQRRLTAGELRAVRRIEHVRPQLNRPAAAQPDVPRNRQIEHARETPLQIIVSRFQADTAFCRPLKRRGVELTVWIAAASGARITDDLDARGEARRAGHVYV